MISRNVLRIVGCGIVFLASLWAFQHPFRQYPGREYGDFPLPPDWQQPAEWVFARLMYPAASGGYGRGFRGATAVATGARDTPAGPPTIPAPTATSPPPCGASPASTSAPSSSR